MMSLTRQRGAGLCRQLCHSSFATTAAAPAAASYKLLVVGGGTGGSAVANSYAKHLGKGQVAVIEPSEHHFYQPYWTLVGGGLKTLAQSQGRTADVLPRQADWIRDKAAQFDPDNCTVTLAGGDVVKYEYLVLAMGMQLNYDKVPGLVEALEHDPRVCSNYSRHYVTKTFPAAQAFTSGNAIFTFPNTPIKCAGAPLKICFLLEDYFTRSGKRASANVMYNTSLPAIFGIPRYAKSFQEIADRRNIAVNKRTSLLEVNHEKSEAVFELLDHPGETVTHEYSLLHAAPPCSSPAPLWGSALVDAAGYVDVDRGTLQHTKYENVFAIGDCNNAPTSKTAAAIASQNGVVMTNLDLVMEGKKPRAEYDGYTSCPLVTSDHTCVLAEFGYDGRILETFPVDQSKERRSMFLMKAEAFPRMYWAMLIKGMWHGPKFFRKIFSLGQA